MPLYPRIASRLHSLISNQYANYFYYIALLLLIFVSILSALAPYYIQDLVRKYILENLSFRTQFLRIILPDNDENDKAWLKALKDALGKNSKKVVVKEIECDRNSSPVEMLIHGKGDITITSSLSCLLNNSKVLPISTAGERAIYIVTPKNYGITEFQLLAGKKIGFFGDVFLGKYVMERLIRFYNFDLSPELITNRFYDIDKAFSSGEIEALVWSEGRNSTSVRKFLDKSWYQIVPIRQLEDFVKTVPGLYSETINYLNEPIKIICTKNVLVVSNKLSNSVIRPVLQAWFSPETISLSTDHTYNIEAFIPPAFLHIHPMAIAFYERDKPLTRRNLITLGFSLLLVALSILLLKQVISIWKNNRNKPYLEELEKRWEEVRLLNYQWDIDLSNEEILLRLRKIKSIYNWTLQSYKQNFIPEKAVILLFTNLVHQLIEFHERYFEWQEKKQIISRLYPEETEKEQTPQKDETLIIKSIYQPIVDDKDKYLKSSPESLTKKEENQMLLFNPEEENKREN
ncbi:MAG TPA: ABC transporter substrate-binding protein [Candidatus Hydrogenedens sp.]|nr:ABC transporter substrate-binding protein [Candidatus Hydrogenedens sp.]